MPAKTKAEVEAEMEAMKKQMDSEREATRREVEQMRMEQKQDVLDLKARLTAAEALKEDPSKPEAATMPPWLQQFMFAQSKQMELQRQQMEAQQHNMEALIKSMSEQRDRRDSSSSSESDTEPVSNFKPTAPPKLDADTSVPKFKAWRASWEDYAKLCNVDAMKLDRQQSLLRSLLSLEMRKVLEKVIRVTDKDCPADILQKIETHLRKKRNVVVDSRDLEDRKQREGETFQEYLIAVTDLAEEADVTAGHCDACQKTCLDRRLASRIISGIRDGETRRKLLALSPFPTLDKVKEICSAEESAHNDDDTMGKRSAAINTVNTDAEKKYPRKKGNRRSQGGGDQQADKCGNCGHDAHKKDEVCPAKDLKCNFCDRRGHFESVCRKKRSQESSEKVQMNRVKASSRRGSPQVQFELLTQRGTSLGQHKAIPDTGAQVSLAGMDLFNSIDEEIRPFLHPATKKLSSIDGSDLHCLGVMPVMIKNDYKEVLTKVYISPQADHFILSFEASCALGYIPANFPEVIDNARINFVKAERLVLQRPRSKKKTTTTKEHRQAQLLYKKTPAVAPFSSGEKVHIQDPVTKLWDKTGTIICAASHGSYKIKLFNGKVYYRACNFVCPFHELKDASSPARKSPGGRDRQAGSDLTAHGPDRSTRATRPPDRHDHSRRPY